VVEKSVIGKSGDWFLTGRSERRFAQRGLYCKPSLNRNKTNKLLIKSTGWN